MAKIVCFKERDKKKIKIITSQVCSLQQAVQWTYQTSDLLFFFHLKARKLCVTTTNTVHPPKFDMPKVKYGQGSVMLWGWSSLSGMRLIADYKKIDRAKQRVILEANPPVVANDPAAEL